MDRATELRALRLLLERDLVTRDQIDAVRSNQFLALDDPVEATQHRSVLDSLIRRGIVDRASVAEVLREAGVEGPALPALEQGPVQVLDTDAVHPSFPVPAWDRFECLELLGRGGMGLVFKARDRRLDRVVALKFLRGDRPELVERFAREARAQAQVEHPNICQVYEVGEVAGIPYIAMQLVVGHTLKEAASLLPLEARVKLMQDVAQALHEAHRIGLIHRDIKPSNIMVEDNDGGLPHPYLMDFGLARQVEERGQTLTGDVLGSPAYMSPEQARGAAHSLDRRSDVYSLGATMYHLLVGRPPFQGSNPVDTLLQVQTEEPAPLRRHDPAIPSDLEAIVMRCLEKAPQRRYESSRALAEDLARFLDGRPPTLGRERVVIRTVRWLQRHRRLAAAVLAVTLAGALVGGLSLRERIAAAERDRMAQLFRSEVQRIDATMRVAHLLPLHGIRADRERVRERMAWIVEQLLTVRGGARAPGWYALGRAHLVLGEHGAAEEQLRAAWDAGYREPDVAWTYGRVLGRIYERQLRELRRGSDPVQRSERLSGLERQLRDPALELLRAGMTAEGVPAAYTRALVARYEGRFQDALDDVSQSLEEAPWLYEAWLIKGDVFSEIAELALEHARVDQAVEALRGAEQAFRTAASIAASDPEVHASSCRLWRRVLEVRLGSGGGDVEEALERAVAACGRALAVDSRRTEEDAVRASCHLAVAQWLAEGGRDPGAELAAARAAAERVLTIDPEHATGLRLWGNSYSLAVEWWSAQAPDDQTASHDEVAEWTVVAAESLLKAAAQMPEDAGFRVDLGRALVRRAAFLESRGDDPRPVLATARDAFELAAELGPEAIAAHLESARVLLRLAAYEAGTAADPSALTDEAVASAERAVALRPDVWETHHTCGVAHLARAELRLRVGSDPRPDLEAAIDGLQRGLSIDPDRVAAERALARTALLLAGCQIGAGEDPTETLILGRAAAERAARLLPRDLEAQRVLGGLLLLSAETSPHRRQRFWWGERAVDLLERLPEASRDESVALELERARRVVRAESGRLVP